ncbi:hypothetical protein [Arenibaculum pallidiluteum]|uniref:hypothetical protein n=1 Tax=Arenibaculum pallidiluteum TaxID=2812559 RepID=UPI001A96D60E|nr:hypothetical protein [Arenibaculum pallidiluteum]
MNKETKPRREPLVAEMVQDPVIQAVMLRDGVSAEDVLTLVVGMRERLRRSGALDRLAA